MYGLTMHNLGSISTQARRRHLRRDYRTGIQFKALPGDVMVPTVLETASSSLARTTSRVRSSIPCSPGLRCTGLIVTVRPSLEPALRYKKPSRLTTWSGSRRHPHAILARAPLVVPTGSAPRIEQSKYRYVYVLGYSGCPKSSSRSLHPASRMMRLPPCSRPSFWRALHTVHLVELLLFIARWPPWLTYYIARCTLWMDSARKVSRRQHLDPQLELSSA